jgi:hypothetical protein
MSSFTINRVVLVGRLTGEVEELVSYESASCTFARSYSRESRRCCLFGYRPA